MSGGSSFPPCVFCLACWIPWLPCARPAPAWLVPPSRRIRCCKPAESCGSWCSRTGMTCIYSFDSAPVSVSLTVSTPLHFGHSRESAFSGHMATHSFPQSKHSAIPQHHCSYMIYFQVRVVVRWNVREPAIPSRQQALDQLSTVLAVGVLRNLHFERAARIDAHQ